MAQTTDQISAKDCTIEISSDGSSWTDISGWTNSITPGGGDRASGSAQTHDGDTPVHTIGKRSLRTLDVNVIYTEGGTDPIETIRGYYENGTKVYLRYSPAGGASGDFMYTGQGYFLTPPQPAADAGSGDPLAVSFTFECPVLTKSTVT